MSPTMIGRRTLLGAAAAALAAPAIRRGHAADAVIRVGSLSDLNSVYSAQSGPGAVEAARLAAADFMQEHPDIKVEVLSADFQLKPDIGLSVSRSWFDTENVDCIVDVPMSALALGLSTLARERNKVVMFTSTATDDLTGKYCGPNHIHWTHDTYALGATVAKALLAQKLDTWFFIMPDYAMGKSQVASMTTVIERSGGKVLGTVAHPFPGTTDFSSYLLQAKASGAKVISLANSGDDAINCVKQAAEFGMIGKDSPQTLAMGLFDAPLVYAVGLHVGQGLTYSASSYWDQNDATRALTKRLTPVLNGKPPSQNHFGDYSGVYQYLKAVAAVGVAKAKADGRAVIAQMKSAPIDDRMLGRCVVRPDGRNVHDMLLMRIKSPAESKGPFDLATIAAVVPGDQVFRSIADGNCPMLKG